MDEKIVRLNIEHFRKLLSEDCNESKRQMILRLLSEEEAKLRLIEEAKAKKQPW